MSFDAKLKALHIELPLAPKPVANYVPVVRAERRPLVQKIVAAYDRHSRKGVEP